MRRVRQICISIPAEWIPVLDARAAVRGISRSSLVTQVIYDAILARSANDRGEDGESVAECKCYHAERNYFGKIGVCWGTKECEACSCGGDESKCDFYPEKRKKAEESGT